MGLQMINQILVDVVQQILRYPDLCLNNKYSQEIVMVIQITFINQNTDYTDKKCLGFCQHF